MNFKTLITSSVLVAGVLVSSITSADMIAEGKAIAYDRKKGNCLACHIVEDGAMPGTVAPALVMMKVRFPKKKVLRKQIWDATVKNKDTMMPPFGKHKILSDSEIDKVVEYIHSL